MKTTVKGLKFTFSLVIILIIVHWLLKARTQEKNLLRSTIMIFKALKKTQNNP